MKKTLVVLLTLVTFDVSALTKIEIFFADISPAPQIKEGIDIMYYDLKGLSKLEDSLSRVLPNNLDQSTTFLNDFFNSKNGIGWLKEAQLHSEAVAKAVSYKLKGIPAVVFDSNSVVYGTANIEEALKEYQYNE